MKQFLTPLFLLSLLLCAGQTTATAQIVSAPTIVAGLNEMDDVYFETWISVGGKADDPNASKLKSRTWIKVTKQGTYKRVEYDGMNGRLTIIVRPDGEYQSFPPSGKFGKKDPPGPEALVNLIMDLQLNGLLAKSVLYVKSGLYQGQPVHIFQSVTVLGADKVTDTFWVSRELSFPLKHRRAVDTSGPMAMVEETRFENVSLKEVPLSVFDIPK